MKNLRMYFSVSTTAEQADIIIKNAEKEGKNICQYFRDKALGTDFQEPKDPTRFDRWLKPDGDSSTNKSKSEDEISFDEWVKPDRD